MRPVRRCKNVHKYDPFAAVPVSFKEHAALIAHSVFRCQPLIMKSMKRSLLTVLLLLPHLMHLQGYATAVLLLNRPINHSIMHLQGYVTAVLPPPDPANVDAEIAAGLMPPRWICPASVEHFAAVSKRAVDSLLLCARRWFVCLSVCVALEATPRSNVCCTVRLHMSMHSTVVLVVVIAFNFTSVP